MHQSWLQCKSSPHKIYVRIYDAEASAILSPIIHFWVLNSRAFHPFPPSNILWNGFSGQLCTPGQLGQTWEKRHFSQRILRRPRFFWKGAGVGAQTGFRPIFLPLCLLEPQFCNLGMFLAKAMVLCGHSLERSVWKKVLLPV